MKKRQNFSIYLLLLIGVFLAFASSCEKDDDDNNNTNNTSDIFTDSRDGTVYEIVTIGSQTWMAENLNYETSSGSWVYDNNSSNASKYGILYDWETACNVCPSGWHLPSDAEWTELENFISGDGHSGTEGTALKATSGWNSNGTDEYGFKALPGGYYRLDGYFYSESNYTSFWSSTAYHSNTAWHRGLSYDYEGVYRYDHDKAYGFSVRCVRD